MKIQVFSDLHLEFAPFVPLRTDADVIILAGDIHIKCHGVEWAKRTFPELPVLYVPGNHEYYGQAIPKHTEKLYSACQNSNVHILENDKMEIGQVTFLGATLWTDFKMFENPYLAACEAELSMTDYKRIRTSPKYRRLRARDTIVMHAVSRAWLRATSAQCPERTIVIVTHHSPSTRSLPENFAPDPLSAAFASYDDSLVEQTGATLWIHGHIHTFADYMIGNTRVICNPRGYPNETTFFNQELVVIV